MKKQIILSLVIVLFLCMASMTFAGDNPLKAQEKKVNASFAALIPADKVVGVDKFYQVYQDVIAGKKKAYLIDVRTYPEFDAFHIEGTDHISSGLMYTIPKKIKDPNAEIYIW
ncbi:MAG: rhodanese-like domain-containing protein, partial [Deltaproteobacteria bacterium]|nr:rhodanese-like domain-containing protein [Deltaproteobacteria bacterium]